MTVKASFFLLLALMLAQSSLLWAQEVPNLEAQADPDEELCQPDYPSGCLLLGGAYLNGIEVEIDIERGAQYIEKACRWGHAEGCNIMGYMVQEEMIEFERATAAELYLRACEMGSTGGCSKLGGIYLEGAEVKQDKQWARRLFEVGCEGDDAMACMGLASTFGYSDWDKSEHYMQRSCELGFSNACYALALAYQEGLSGEGAKHKAPIYFERACDEGVAEACEHL